MVLVGKIGTHIPAWPGRGRRGQAMLEYIIVAGVLIASVAVCALLLYALRQQSSRVLDLVASDYP